MNDLQNKNDYSAIIFFNDTAKKPFKMVYVHRIYSLSQWLDRSNAYNDWHYMNVYARRSGRYIGRYYRGNFIPKAPE